MKARPERFLPQFYKGELLRVHTFVFGSVDHCYYYDIDGTILGFQSTEEDDHSEKSDESASHQV
jgi:hypothetical protein